jgi:hypothetical protein
MVHLTIGSLKIFINSALHDTIKEQEGPEVRKLILILWQIQHNLSAMKKIANQD